MPRFCANLTVLYGEHDFLDRFRAAADDGFAGVEYLFPYDWPAAELAERLERHKLVQVLHNLPAGDWAGGERGVACLPDRVDEFQDGVGQAVAYATALDCKRVNCLVGLTPKDTEPEEVRRTLVSNLTFAAAELNKAGVRLLIEPVNTRDVPGFHLTTTGAAAAILDAVGSDNLFIQYDFYHAQVMEGDLAETFRRFKDRIAHVQVADNPGRHEPGTGEINYPFLFDRLDREGYAGWVGCEYKPAAGTGEGLGWLGRGGATGTIGEATA